MKSDLTPRQTEIVRLVSLGCSTEEIAKILGVAVSTADNHKAAAMKIWPAVLCCRCLPYLRCRAALTSANVKSILMDLKMPRGGFANTKAILHRLAMSHNA
jgi:hypothetical protein